MGVSGYRQNKIRAFCKWATRCLLLPGSGRQAGNHCLLGACDRLCGLGEAGEDGPAQEDKHQLGRHPIQLRNDHGEWTDCMHDLHQKEV